MHAVATGRSWDLVRPASLVQEANVLEVLRKKIGRLVGYYEAFRPQTTEAPRRCFGAWRRAGRVGWIR